MQAAASELRSPADDFARRRAEQSEAGRLRALQALTPRPNAQTKEAAPASARAGTVNSAGGAAAGGGVCFPIDSVAVEGAKALPARALAKIAKPYQGRCIGLTDIQILIKALTQAYFDRGFIAARVYLPEQNIKQTRLLRLMVMEGRLDGLYYNGRPIRDLSAAEAESPAEETAKSGAKAANSMRGMAPKVADGSVNGVRAVSSADGVALAKGASSAGIVYNSAGSVNRENSANYAVNADRTRTAESLSSAKASSPNDAANAQRLKSGAVDIGSVGFAQAAELSEAAAFAEHNRRKQSANTANGSQNAAVNGVRAARSGRIGDYSSRRALGILYSAFPGLMSGGWRSRGESSKPLNMREIEQGLDQMNRLATGGTARSELLPGRNEGGVIVNIIDPPHKNWRAGLTHDTLGQASTGYARYNASLIVDQALGLNDEWNFAYQRTDKAYWSGHRQNGTSNSYSGGVSVPHGVWTLNAGGYYYDYKSAVQGNFSRVRTSGDSNELRAGASRLLYRDSRSLTLLSFGLAHKETNNFLMGSKIEVGSRHYTVGNIGLSHSRQVGRSIWAFDIGFMRGLPWFGAVARRSAAAGGADPEFSKGTASLNVQTPFRFATQDFILSNLVSGQYSPNNLFGSEQISLGNYSDVRGSRESLLFANSGFFSRNELALRLAPWRDRADIVRVLGELRPYIGLDFGRVFAKHHYGIVNGHLASGTAGARLVGGAVSLEAGWSALFARAPKGDKVNMAFISMGVTF